MWLCSFDKKTWFKITGGKVRRFLCDGCTVMLPNKMTLKNISLKEALDYALQFENIVLVSKYGQYRYKHNTD